MEDQNTQDTEEPKTSEKTEQKTPEETGQKPPEETPEPPKPEEPKLPGREQLKKLKKSELQEWCKKMGHSTAGKKPELINRLCGKPVGYINNFVPAKMLCRYCRAKATVRRTVRATLGDGRVLVTRHLRCQGKNIHRYALKKIETPE